MTIIKKHWPIVFLVIISSILSLLNYSPNTFLSGWDTLHPEFDFGLNIQRAIFGVFRIEQGLGAVAAHSHMADLPRIIILYISHFVLPIEFLRYFYVFLSVVIGPIGMYLFLQKHLLKNKNASFLGALFYLLNLGTMQIFNVPFEMFTTLFATLPFVFYFATNFLKESEKRTQNLLIFAIFVLFTSPSSYASTLWYVFFACFIFYIFSLILLNLKSKEYKLRDGFILILLTLLLNLFWLAPNIYFVLNHAKDVQTANINLLFSDQAFLKNKEFGNLESVLFLKIFYFDWNIFNGTKFVFLLEPYINYLKDVKVLTLGFGFGLAFVSGMLISAIKLKKNSIPFFILLLISLFFLINDNFPFSSIFKFLQNQLPFFKEALRFPDDKVLNIYVFLISIFFGYFCLFVLEKVEKRKWASILFVVLTALLIFYYNLPSFGGNFINKFVRVDIPKAYFELFDYLKLQDESEKVANLPMHSPYGWVYYNWSGLSESEGARLLDMRGLDKPSFQGAGFLYFGIKQPLLDRDFDRWSHYNESYYREMSYAIYKKDVELLKNVIKKYDLGFIFVDTSVYDSQHPPSAMFFDESKKLIRQTGLIEEEKIFGTITLYKLTKNKTGYFGQSNTNINVNPPTKTLYSDVAYNTYGDYLTATPKEEYNNLIFPFRNLIDNQSRLLPNILSLDSEKIVINPSDKIQRFDTSNFADNINIIPSDVLLERKNNSLNVSIYPNTPVFDQTPSSSPIKGTLNVAGNSQNLYFSANQNELFKLDKLLENTPVAIGKILLKNADNDIALFDSTDISPVLDISKKINPFFSNCDEKAAPPSVEVTDANITIKANSNICILVPLGFFENTAKSDTNLLTNFGFEINGGGKITSCLYNQETSKCLYYKDPEKSADAVNFVYALKTTQTEKRAIKIFIDKKIVGQENIKLFNFRASSAKALSEAVIPKNTLTNAFIKTADFSFDKIYLPNNIIYNPGFEITNLKKLESDCKGPLQVGVKKELVAENGRKAIKYSSQVGSFCDHFSYPNLVHNLGYFLVVDSKNVKGLPISICISNYTSGRCDIYTHLSSKNNFTKQVFLLPPTDGEGIGYDINLENLGIEKSPSENYLSSLQFIPIPYELLGNVKQGTMQSTNIFNGNVISEKQLNPAMYLVTTDGKPLILTLSYSFEKGFKAYPISCKSELSCFVKTLLAPIVVEELPHVLVNNWKNGWIVGNSNLEVRSSKFAIVFLPQYLEWLGFVIILIVFSTLLVKLKKSS